MPGCIMGNVLHIDLTTGKHHVEHPSEEFYRKYAGGSAMGLYYLLREMPPHTDPLGPENILTLFTGPLTGLPISGQSRITANALSPLGNAIGDSQAGGFFPAALKKAGFDGIVIRGQSPKPVYLLIQNGKVQLLDAADLWGKETAKVDLLLEQRHGKVEVMQIGPAGEKLVRFAAIMNMHTRANGRTGMGAVMGSKNLKAIVVNGNLHLKAADPAMITHLNREGTKNIPLIPDMKGLQLNGTADCLPFQQLYGSLPSFNYSEGTFDHFEEISGEHMTSTILVDRETCFGCTVGCKRVVETEYEDRKVERGYGGPEYETIATLGSYCGIADLDVIALGNQMCNQYGMDTISCGATIAFAMECFEKGLITLEDTDGLELRFGSADAMLEVIRLIGERRGFGEILAEGSARAAARLGKGTESYLTAVKGTEAPAHMPQAKKSLGLIYAVNPFGADHQSSEHDPFYEEGVSELALSRLAHLGLGQPQAAYSWNKEKITFAYLTELFFSALDSYCLCQFVFGPAWELYGPAEMAEILRAGTGWDVTVREIMEVGERRLNMMRAFNARQGFNREQDALPKKFFKPLTGTGPTAGVAWKPEDLEWSKDLYYQLAGWEVETGNPSQEKLKQLGLEWIDLQHHS